LRQNDFSYFKERLTRVEEEDFEELEGGGGSSMAFKCG
jgi:hypothetical protein